MPKAQGAMKNDLESMFDFQTPVASELASGNSGKQKKQHLRKMFLQTKLSVAHQPKREVEGISNFK